MLTYKYALMIMGFSVQLAIAHLISFNIWWISGIVFVIKDSF